MNSVRLIYLFLNTNNWNFKIEFSESVITYIFPIFYWCTSYLFMRRESYFLNFRVSFKLIKQSLIFVASEKKINKGRVIFLFFNLGTLKVIVWLNFKELFKHLTIHWVFIKLFENKVVIFLFTKISFDLLFCVVLTTIREVLL